MNQFLLVFLSLFATDLVAQNLWQPYYITPRLGQSHLDLSNMDFRRIITKG